MINLIHYILITICGKNGKNISEPDYDFHRTRTTYY